MRRRLQREPDLTGGTLSRFRDVFLRHGLPGLLLALFLLAWPGLWQVGEQSLADFFADPIRYFVRYVLVGAGLLAYIRWRQRELDAATVGWMLYLLVLSVWEEWLFRVAIPYGSGATGAGLVVLVVGSNLVFGMMHYFTLRWRWQWCVLATLGGLALSRQMHVHFDLAQLVLLHWVGTILNTPSPPGTSANVAQSRL